MKKTIPRLFFPCRVRHVRETTIERNQQQAQKDCENRGAFQSNSTTTKHRTTSPIDKKKGKAIRHMGFSQRKQQPISSYSESCTQPRKRIGAMPSVDRAVRPESPHAALEVPTFGADMSRRGGGDGHADAALLWLELLRCVLGRRGSGEGVFLGEGLEERAGCLLRVESED
jgi:hypothetical protein